MGDPKENPIWKLCDKHGIAWAKHLLHTEGSIETRAAIQAWLEFAEHEAKERTERLQHELSERSVSAAELSASAAQEAAKTSATSARAAMFAAAVSFFAALVALAAYLK